MFNGEVKEHTVQASKALCFCRGLLVGVCVLAMLSFSAAADLYWDTDTGGPLVGSSSTLNLSGSYFSTAPSGDTALTNISSGDSVYFQTDAIQSYTCHLDTAQTIPFLTVSNGNDVTITTDDGSLITCTNTVSVSGGSRLVFQHNANARVLHAVNDDAQIPQIVLGSGDNTFLIRGTSSSTAYWIAGLSGDYGDKFGASNNNHWTVNTVASTFGGELIGVMRFSPGTIILSGDSPNFIGKLEGGNVTFGDGGTSGSISTNATFQLGTLKFNRSDDYTFTNDITIASGANIHNIGSGAATILSDLTGSAMSVYGDKGTLRGDIVMSQRLWFEDPGTWTLTGSNYVGGQVYSDAVQVRGGSTLRIGDGTTGAKLTVTNNFRCSAGSDLIMDLRAGAQLAASSNVVAGAGMNLIIIGGGQEDPIITFGNALTPFENVVYNNKTNTWAEAQVTGALYGLGGKTQLRIDGNDIYIDALPPTGMIIILK